MSKKHQPKQNNPKKPKNEDRPPSKLEEPNATLEALSSDKSNGNKQKIHSLQRVSYTESVSYSGPIPDPETLRRYNDAFPNGTEKIFLRAEKQSEHRMNMEKFAIENQFRQSARGQIFGFILALLVIIIGGLLAYLGLEGIGTTLIVVGLGSAISVFVLGKNKQKKNLSEKNPN